MFLFITRSLDLYHKNSTQLALKEGQLNTMTYVNACIINNLFLALLTCSRLYCLTEPFCCRDQDGPLDHPALYNRLNEVIGDVERRSGYSMSKGEISCFHGRIETKYLFSCLLLNIPLVVEMLFKIHLIHFG